MKLEHDYPLLEHELNCRIPNGTYGGVRGKETKVGQKTSFPDLLDFSYLTIPHQALFSRILSRVRI